MGDCRVTIRLSTVTSKISSYRSLCDGVTVVTVVFPTSLTRHPALLSSFPSLPSCRVCACKYRHYRHTVTKGLLDSDFGCDGARGDSHNRHAYSHASRCPLQAQLTPGLSFWAISWNDSRRSKILAEKSAIMRPDEASTISLHTSQTDCSVVVPPSGESFRSARVPSMVKTEGNYSGTLKSIDWYWFQVLKII